MGPPLVFPPGVQSKIHGPPARDRCARDRCPPWCPPSPGVLLGVQFKKCNPKKASIQTPASQIQLPKSSIQIPVPSIQNPASRIQQPTSSIQNPACKIQPTKSRIQNPAF